MEKTPEYSEANTRDPRNPPLEPEGAGQKRKGAKGRVPSGQVDT